MKYKLIKKYPKSPEVGSTVSKICNSSFNRYYKLDQRHGWNTFSKSEIEDYPEHWQKVRDTDYLFLSDDGQPVFTDDIVHMVLPKAQWETHFDRVISHNVTERSQTWMYFKKKEQALEFIKHNKPFYSLNDIEKCIERATDRINGEFFEEIKFFHDERFIDELIKLQENNE